MVLILSILIKLVEFEEKNIILYIILKFFNWESNKGLDLLCIYKVVLIFLYVLDFPDVKIFAILNFFHKVHFYEDMMSMYYQSLIFFTFVL